MNHNAQKEVNKLTNLEVKNLIKLAQSGDGQALQKVFDAFGPFRKKLASKFSGRGVENADVMQQIDLFFIESIMDYDENLDQSAIRHITKKTARRTLYYYRQQINYSRRFIASGLFVDAISNKEKLNRETFVDSFINVKSFLDGLDDFELEVVKMQLRGGMTQYQIAERLGVSRGRVQRALYDIRRRFGKNFFKKK